MLKQLFTIRIVMACLACFAGTALFSQKIMLSTEDGQLFVVDLSTNPCTVEKQSYADGWGIQSLAMFRNSYFYTNTQDKRVYRVTGHPPNQVKTVMPDNFALDDGGIRTLTMDKTGRLHLITNRDNSLETYFVEALVGGNHGPSPFKGTGDMVFYKDKLYLSSDAGIVASRMRNSNEPSQLIIPTSRVFPGLVNVVTGCNGENKVYGVETVGTITNLVEIDLDNKRILGVYRSFSLNDAKVSDAASPNETGEPAFIGINTISSKRLCFPDTTHEVTINAYTPAGDSGLTYTFTKGAETIGPFSSGGGVFTFTGQMNTGRWSLNIKSSTGCSRDTSVTIYPPGKVAVAVSTRPDTCNSDNGAVIVTILEGKPPYAFQVEGKAAQLSPEVSGLAPGNYKMKIFDSTECSADVTFTIASYTPPTPVTSVTVIPATTCNPKGEINLVYRPSANVSSVKLDNDSFPFKSHFTDVSPGTHRLQVRIGNCVFDTTVSVPVSAAVPVIDSVVTNNVCVGRGSIKLVISGTEAPYRFSLGGSLYNSGTTVTDLPSGNYPVVIYNAARCSIDTLQFTIREKENCDTIRAIYIPSAFTPNGDGKNDILTPQANPAGKIVRFVFRVYNRDGQVVFESRSPDKGWDGNYKGMQQPTAVYVWVFQGTGPDGKQVIYKGTTLLLR